MRALLIAALIALLGALPAHAKTIVDTDSTQTIQNKTFDTTNTFPSGLGGGTTINSGTTLPATCTVGSLFFKTDATAGQNLYECAATNVWTQQLNSGAGGASTALDNLAALSINSALLAQSGVDLGSTIKPFRHLFLFGGGSYGTNYFQLAGTPTGTRVLSLPDLTDTLVSKTSSDTLTNKTLTSPVLTTPTLGVASATTVNKVTLTAPATGSTLTIPDGVTLTGPSASATVATLGLTNTLTGRQDATGAASTGPAKTGTSIPGTCVVGDLFFKSDATAGQNLYQCATTNVFTQQLNSGASGASTALSNLAAVSVNTSLLAQTGVDLGSTTKPFRDLYLFGGGTYATNYWRFTGTPTSTRTLTVPDVTGTLVTGTGTANQVAVYSGSNAAPGSSTATWDGTTFGLGAGSGVSVTTAALTANRTFTLPDADSNPVVPSTCSGSNVVNGINSGGVLLCVAGGGSGTGIVSSGVIAHLALYAATGTTVDDATNLTFDDTNKVLTIGSGTLQTITSATLTGARTFTLPNADSNPVQPLACTAPQFINAIAATGALTCGTPSVTAGAAAALDNLAAVSINTALLAQTGIDLGSTTKPFRNLYLSGTGTYGTNYLQLTGAPTGARVLTAPDATDTLVGKATVDSLTNKTLDAEGTGNVITLPFKLWLPMGGCVGTTAAPLWDVSATNPAVATCGDASNIVQGHLAFADGANTLSAMYHWALPSDWTGAIDAKLKWFTTATTGSVVWQIDTICVADAETNNPAMNTPSTVTDAAKGTTLQLNDATITGVTITGCGAGELLHLEVFRDPTHASDDLAAAANLIGVELTYRRAL